MITRTYKYNIQLDEEVTQEGVSRFPVSWQVTTTSSCITIINSFGTLTQDGNIEFTINATDETCIENGTATLTLNDNIGCPTTYNISLVNPCDLVLSDISASDTLDFSVVATGGAQPYTYEWFYDTSLFTTSNNTSPVLSLQPIEGQYIDRTILSVKVTDSNGCVQEKEYNQQLCSMVVEGKTINTYCVSVIDDELGLIKAVNSNFTIPILSSCDIDWDTFSYTSTNSGIVIIHQGNGVFRMNILDGTSAGTSIVNYTVKNEYGVSSPVGSLIVNIPSCSEVNNGGDTIDGEIQEGELNSSNIVGDVIELNVEENIYSTSPIRWSTFNFTQNPAYGTATFTPSRVIEYEITDLTGSDADQIGFEIENESGQILRRTYYINRNVAAAPVANALTVCATCNTPTSAIDITSNDTGDIDKSTIIITSSSGNIDISRNSDNDFIFTPNSSATFINNIRYKVANSQGVFSNEAIVIVSSACAGEPVRTDITCSSQTFNLADLFPNTNAFSRSFAEVTTSYTTQGGTITGANGAVDFTSITAGEYIFSQTAVNAGSCSGTDDVKQVTVVKQDIPALTINSGTIVATDVGQVTFTATNIALGSITILNNGGRPIYTSSPVLVGSSGSFNLQLSAGNNEISLQANTICGNNILRTITIAN